MDCCRKAIGEPNTDTLIANDSAYRTAISSTPATKRKPNVAGVGAAELYGARDRDKSA